MPTEGECDERWQEGEYRQSCPRVREVKRTLASGSCRNISRRIMPVLSATSWRCEPVSARRVHAIGDDKDNVGDGDEVGAA